MKIPKLPKKPKAASKRSAETSSKKVRTRLTGVRGRVLSLLGGGPLTSSELVSKGGFSAASLYLNLKALKQDGLIQTVRNGRSVLISLTDTAGAIPPPTVVATAEPTPKKRGRKPKAVLAAAAKGDLSEALADLALRLSPVERLQDKLLVLDQLARTMPAPVASVLKEVIADLGRR